MEFANTCKTTLLAYADKHRSQWDLSDHIVSPEYLYDLFDTDFGQRCPDSCDAVITTYPKEVALRTILSHHRDTNRTTAQALGTTCSMGGIVRMGSDFVVWTSKVNGIHTCLVYTVRTHFETVTIISSNNLVDTE